MKNLKSFTLFVGTILSWGLSAQSVFELKSADSDYPFVSWDVGTQAKYAVGKSSDKRGILYDLTTHAATRDLGCVGDNFIFHAGSTHKPNYDGWSARGDELSRPEVFAEYHTCTSDVERIVYLKDPSRTWDGAEFRIPMFMGAYSDTSASDAYFIQTDNSNGKSVERLWDAEKYQVIFETGLQIVTLERNQSGDRLLLLENGSRAQGVQTAWHYFAIDSQGAHEIARIPYIPGSGFTDLNAGARMISPDGNYLTVLGGDDWGVQVYDGRSGAQLYGVPGNIAEGLDGSIKNYNSYVNMHAMIITLRDNEANDYTGIFDLHAKAWITKPDQNVSASDAFFSPDNRHLLFLDGKGSHLIETATQKVLADWADQYVSPQFSANSQFLLLNVQGGQWGHRNVVEAATGKVLIDYAFGSFENDDNRDAPNFSPDYKLYAVASHLFDLETGKEFTLPASLTWYDGLLANKQIVYFDRGDASPSGTTGVYDLKTATKVLSLDAYKFGSAGHGFDGQNRAVFSLRLNDNVQPPIVQSKLYVYEFTSK